MRQQYIILKMILLLMFLWFKGIQGQPYKYYFDGQDWKNASIFRLNMQNGEKVEFLANLGRTVQLIVTPDQSRIIYTDLIRMFAFKVDDPNNITEIMDMYDESRNTILHILDAPKTSKMYVMLGNIEYDPKMTVVLDRNSFSILDTLYGIYFYSLPFLSNDETKIFRLIPDYEGIYFKLFDINGNVIDDKLKCGSIGPFIDYYTHLNDSKLGHALVSFEYPGGFDFENLYYVVCNPDQATYFTPISFPWRSDAYLSPDAQNVIIEEVRFIKDDDPNTPAEYRPGNVFVFDAETGVLKQRLRLPPEGEILLFDTHPDQMFYYRPDAPQEPVSVYLTHEQSDTDLIDMLISDVNTAYQKGRINNKGIYNSLNKKLVNAKKHLEKGKTKQAVNMLNAFLNEVEAQKDKHLTSEAYVLLKYNVEFLIERLAKK